MNAMMRSIGLVDTEMYGGYLIERDVSQRRSRSASTASRTGVSASGRPPFDLARLARAIWLASAARGPLRAAQPGFTPRDARYLLYLLAHVRDQPKLEPRCRAAFPGVAVLHKAGWINKARHDNGLVVWRGGVFVAAVMTYRASGAGVSSDVLAGRVAALALRRFRG